MDKEAVLYIHNGILLSHKKNAFESVLMRWMNLDLITQREINQKEKNQVSYVNAYIWNLERQYWWTYLQRSNVDTDIENRLWRRRGGVEEREGGMYGENNMEICITVLK